MELERSGWGRGRKRNSSFEESVSSSEAESSGSLKNPNSSLKSGLARAAIRGIIRSGSPPSLLRTQVNESRLVSRSRSTVHRFLLNAIKARRKPSNRSQPRESSSSSTTSIQAIVLASLDWLPVLIKNNTSHALREAASTFFMETLRTKDNQFDIIDQACFLLAQTSADADSHPIVCLDLVAHLCCILPDHPQAIKRAAEAGIIKSCSVLLERLMDTLVATELKYRIPPDSSLLALTSLLLLISTLHGEPSLKERCRRELPLLPAMACMEALHVGQKPVFECAAKLRELYIAMDLNAEATVRETAKALNAYLPRIRNSETQGGKDFARLFPFVSALSIVLNETVNAIVPKYKVPDVTLQLQRAPTQEEYFRSGLNKSTISLLDVPCSTLDGVEAPRVQDLKFKIATELGMSGSLEMFELVVAGKILGPDLELARVFERIWKPHVAERTRNLAASSAAGAGGSGAGRGNGGEGTFRSAILSSSSAARRMYLARSDAAELVSPSGGGIFRPSFAPRFADLELSLPSRAGIFGSLSGALSRVVGAGNENAGSRGTAAMQAVVLAGATGLDDDDDDGDDDDDVEDDERGDVPPAFLSDNTQNQHVPGLGDSVDGDDDDDEDDSGSDSEIYSAMLGGRAPGRKDDATGGANAIVYPPMTITYRLCAVDGEATEDFVSTLPLGEGEAVGKKEFFAATTEYGEQGLRSLLSIVGLCVDNLRTWPFPVAKDLLLLTLTALEQCVTHNGSILLRLGALPVLLRCLVDCSTSATAGGDALSSLCLSILDRLVSGPTGMEELEEGAFTASSSSMSSLPAEMGGDQLDWVLERLDSFSANRPKLVTALAKLAPHLINGRQDKAKQLAAQLMSKKDEPWTLSVIENLSSSSPDAMLLRDALYELGVPHQCVLQINKSTPEILVEHAGRPETLLALRMLKGLVRGHSLSARLICESSALATIVRLEEISSTKVEQVGELACAVLEALSSPSSAPAVRDAVARAQKERKEEQRMLAMRKRSRAMKSMNKSGVIGGPSASSSSSALAVAPPSQANKKQKRWMDEMTMLEEEDASLVCVVCHEGYRSKPQHLICAYTFERSVPLPQGATFLSGSGQVRHVLSLPSLASSTVYGVSSASSFVCIHQACHETAARADRAHPKAPKDEWEGAEIRNGHVKCNNLMPLKGNAPPAVYDTAIHSFFERVDRDTKVKVSSGSFSSDPSLFSIVAHDIRLVLQRISYGEALTEDTKGGSVESNLKLLVPLLQMGTHLLASDPSQKTQAETLFTSYITSSSASAASSSSSTASDFAFASVLSLFLLDTPRWQELRLDVFLKNGVVQHAMATQTNALNGDASSIGSGLLASSAVAAAAAAAAGAGGSSGIASGGRARARSRTRSLSMSTAGPTESDTAQSPTDKSDSVPRTIRPWLVFFALVDRVHRYGPVAKMPDKTALDAAQNIAQDARQIVSIQHSMHQMAEIIGLPSRDQLKEYLSL